MEWIKFSISAICIALGLFVFIMGIFGIYKFKFVLNRMHAAAMLDTMGLFFIILGVAIAQGFTPSMIKLLLIVFFLWITSPVSAHFIAKLEYLTDADLGDEIENDLSETEEIEDEEIKESRETKEE